MFLRFLPDLLDPGTYLCFLLFLGLGPMTACVESKLKDVHQFE